MGNVPWSVFRRWVTCWHVRVPWAPLLPQDGSGFGAFLRKELNMQSVLGLPWEWDPTLLAFPFRSFPNKGLVARQVNTVLPQVGLPSANRLGSSLSTR